MQTTENNTQLPILIASFSAVFGTANDAEAPKISRFITCSRAAYWEGMWKKISSPFSVPAIGSSSRCRGSFAAGVRNGIRATLLTAFASCQTTVRRFLDEYRSWICLPGILMAVKRMSTEPTDLKIRDWPPALLRATRALQVQMDL